MIDEFIPGEQGKSSAGRSDQSEQRLLPAPRKPNRYKDYADRYKKAATAKIRILLSSVSTFCKWVGKWTKAILGNANLLTAAATIAIAILTGFYTHYARKQWKTMEDQLTAAEWASYNACLSNQISRRALLEVQKTNAISQEMAVASAQQAAGEVDTDKSYIVFDPRMPKPEEFALNDPDFEIVYSIKNDGKAPANNVHIGFRAIFVSNDQVLKINKTIPVEVQFDYLPAGASDPGIPEVGRPMTLFIKVRDINGNYVPKASADIQKLFSDSAIIAVIAHITYSDFAGNHEERFCSPLYEMQAGTTRKEGPRPNEKTCFDYNHRPDNYAFAAKPTSETTEASLPEIICRPPKRD